MLGFRVLQRSTKHEKSREIFYEPLSKILRPFLLSNFFFQFFFIFYSFFFIFSFLFSPLFSLFFFSIAAFPLNEIENQLTGGKNFWKAILLSGKESKENRFPDCDGLDCFFGNFIGTPIWLEGSKLLGTYSSRRMSRIPRSSVPGEPLI